MEGAGRPDDLRFYAGSDLVVGDETVELLGDDAQLQPGEVRSEAPVVAAAEGTMPRVAVVGVKAVCLRESPGVAVDRAEAEQHR